MPELPILQVRNLSVSYARKTILDKVNLSFAPYSITAIVGPSGCGKTSLLSCINRLTDLIGHCEVKGEITYGDLNIMAKDCDVLSLRRRIGMIFQKPNPFPMSIYKNLAYPLREHGIRDKGAIDTAITGVLKEVNLWDEVKDDLHRPALDLSGGQQQRLCIARALVIQPEVILLDEPCSALDPISTAAIERLMQQLKQRFTLIMVTHNLAQAKRVADQVVVCWQQNGVGCPVEWGATDQIFCNPQNAHTIAYISGLEG